MSPHASLYVRLAMCPAVALLFALIMAPAAAQPADVADDSGNTAEVVLPRGLPDTPVAEFLKTGRFSEALAATDTVPARPHEIATSLYLKGVAQLNLAQHTGRGDTLMDAGLNFVRVLAWFPDSREAGPALVELAYVHARLGRPALARRLYERAAGILSPADQPEYHARLIKLQQSLPQLR